MANVSVAPKLKATNWSPLRLLAQRSDGLFIAQRPGGTPANAWLSLVSWNYLDHEDWTNARSTNLYNCGTLKSNNGTALTTCVPKNIATTTQGFFLTCLDSTSNKYFLYKSGDNGLNWGNNAPFFNNGQAVLDIGTYAGVQSAFIGNLGSRNICERTRTGEIFLTEYSQVADANRTATTPSTPGNNQMIIRRSTDGGTTWPILWEQNTDGRLYAGTASWRHFHCIKYDATRDLIFIGTGDRMWDSGYIIWNPNYSWPKNNCTWGELLGAPGFSGLGGVHAIHNATDFIILKNSPYVVHITDGWGTGWSNGLHRFKVSDPANTFETVYTLSSDRLGAYGVQLADGTLAAVEFSLGTLVKRVAYIHTSRDPDGADWKQVGVIYRKDVVGSDSLSPVDLFACDNNTRVVWVHDDGAGKMASNGNTGFGTSVMSVSGLHDQYDLEETVIHPICYVNSSHPNAQASKTGAAFYTQGNYIDYPLSTVSAAFGPTGIVHGTRFECAAGHVETIVANIAVTYAQPASLNPQGTPRVWIAGAGMGQSLIQGGGASYIFYLGASSLCKYLGFEDIQISQGAGTVTPIQTDTGATPDIIYSRRVRWGGTTNTNASHRVMGMASITAWDSEFLLPSTAGTGNVVLASSARSIRLYNSLIQGSVEAVYVTNGCTELTISQTDIQAPSTRCINIVSLPTSLRIQNVALKVGSAGATNGIFLQVDAAGTITGVCQDAFSSPVTGVAQSIAVLPIVGDPAISHTPREAVATDAALPFDAAGANRLPMTNPGRYVYRKIVPYIERVAAGKRRHR